jgi:hypothetical protein
MRPVGAGVGLEWGWGGIESRYLDFHGVEADVGRLGNHHQKLGSPEVRTSIRRKGVQAA